MSELLGAPVIELGSSFNFSNRHPLNLTGASHGRLMPADVSILGFGAHVLRELMRVCQGRIGDDLRHRIEERTARAQEVQSVAAGRLRTDLKERWWAQKPISTARLAAEIWDVIRDEIRAAIERGVQLVKDGRLALIDTVTQPR